MWIGGVNIKSGGRLGSVCQLWNRVTAGKRHNHKLNVPLKCLLSKGFNSQILTCHCSVTDGTRLCLCLASISQQEMCVTVWISLFCRGAEEERACSAKFKRGKLCRTRIKIYYKWLWKQREQNWSVCLGFSFILLDTTVVITLLHCGIHGSLFHKLGMINHQILCCYWCS